jgi:hypothetical protein
MSGVRGTQGSRRPNDSSESRRSRRVAPVVAEDAPDVVRLHDPTQLELFTTEKACGAITECTSLTRPMGLRPATVACRGSGSHSRPTRRPSTASVACASLQQPKLQLQLQAQPRQLRLFDLSSDSSTRAVSARFRLRTPSRAGTARTCRSDAELACTTDRTAAAPRVPRAAAAARQPDRFAAWLTRCRGRTAPPGGSDARHLLQGASLDAAGTSRPPSRFLRPVRTCRRLQLPAMPALVAARELPVAGLGTRSGPWSRSSRPASRTSDRNPQDPSSALTRLTVPVCSGGIGHGSYLVESCPIALQAVRR